MATLTLRLDDQVRDRLQALADGRGSSVSDVVRSLIDGLFDRDRDEPRRPSVPESIAPVDRQQLALLHRILARLVEDQAEDKRLVSDGDTAHQLDRAEALEAGWAYEYDREFYAMSPELSRRDCGLVVDLMELFALLSDSLAAAPGELTAEEERVLRFQGFDPDDELEGRMAKYARWVASTGRWAAVSADLRPDQAETWISHTPRLPVYRRLLAAYDAVRGGVGAGSRGGLLEVDQLRRIAAGALGS